jgi:uncharacterized protein YbjT (DUF2867 family)
MYVITGATGHVGGGIANLLLSMGKQVRVIGRSADRLSHLVELGAEAYPGNMEDPDYLTRAFTGAEAVFTMIPPNVKAENLRSYQNRFTDSIVKAVKNSGVKYVVNLSSIGAQLTENTGPVLGLRDQEVLLNDISGLNVVHLRPSYFMENLYGYIEMIRTGIIGGSLRADLKVPYIATADIASEASKYMVFLDFSGSRVRYLLGERDISMNEIAKIIGRFIHNRKLRYLQFSYEDAIKGMIGMGISPDVARAFNDLSRAANEGILVKGIKRDNDSTTDTRFEKFAKSFATLIKSAA